MSEEKRRDPDEERSGKAPDKEREKDATPERVEEEEKTGGALPSNRQEGD